MARWIVHYPPTFRVEILFARGFEAAEGKGDEGVGVLALFGLSVGEWIVHWLFAITPAVGNYDAE